MEATTLDLGPLEKGKNGNVVNVLVRKIRDAIQTGKLRSGDRIPPSRKLAKELQIARGSVVNALEILMAEELLIARRGAGVFVADLPSPPVRLPDVERAEFPLPLPPVPDPDIDRIDRTGIDFRPCRPSVAEFPLNLWKRCLARAGSKPLSPDYGDPLGSPGLRQCISDYLRRSRGLAFSTEDIIITNGILHGLSLISDLFLARGDKVVIEDPGYPLVRQVLKNKGAELIACPVDGDGLIVDALPKQCGRLKFVYVTPSHQFPEGTRLSSLRRNALIEWAQDNGVVILEDDYDGEYRYDVPPLPPLAAIPNRCTVYLGTFSKSLFPDLRLGFAVGAAPLIHRLGKLRSLQDYAPSSVLQNALSGFIQDGHFESHIHRMRRIYRTKRQSVIQAVRNVELPGRLTGLDSGLHGMLTFDEGCNADALAQMARVHGLLVASANRYRLEPSDPSNSLIVGYAAPSLEEIERGISTLHRLLQNGSSAVSS